MRIKCRCESCGRDWYADSSLNGENQLGCPYCSLARNSANHSRAAKFATIQSLLRNHQKVIICSAIALVVLFALVCAVLLAGRRIPAPVNTTALTIASTQKVLLDRYSECKMQVQARNADELQQSAQKARDAIAGTVRSAEMFKGEINKLVKETKTACKTVSDELCQISPDQANRIRDCRRLKSTGQPDLAIEMKELWLQSDKCDEAAIRVGIKIDEVVDFGKSADSVVVRNYEDLSRLAEMTRKTVEMLNRVRLSGDVDFIRKKGTFIKSKGQKAAQHEQKRIRIKSQEKSRAEKAQQALRETKERLRRIDGD